MAMSRSLGGSSFTTPVADQELAGVIDSRPAIMRRVVLLPQPDGPTSTTNSPSRDLEIEVVDRHVPAALLIYFSDPTSFTFAMRTHRLYG